MAPCWGNALPVRERPAVMAPSAAPMEGIPKQCHPLRLMQIERNELRCFQAVIETGGFSRAAERLDLSQSAVSQTIANLEHRLGTVLLRRGHPPQLTEAGIRLLRFAEKVLNEE